MSKERERQRAPFVVFLLVGVAIIVFNLVGLGIDKTRYISS